MAKFLVYFIQGSRGSWYLFNMKHTSARKFPLWNTSLLNESFRPKIYSQHALCGTCREMYVAFITVASLNNAFLLPFSSAPTLAEEATLKQKCLLTTEL